MKKTYITFLIIAAMLLVSACGSNEVSDDIGIRGEVTNITTGQENIVILVEGKVEDDTIHDKASVTIKPGTSVVKQGEDKTDTAAKPEDIKLFDKVEVVFDGPVMESYPVQGTAKLIRILY